MYNVQCTTDNIQKWFNAFNAFECNAIVNFQEFFIAILMAMQFWVEKVEVNLID